MKYIFLHFIVCIVPLSFSFGQNGCRSIDSIVLEIKKANFLSNQPITSSFSSHLEFDPQYIRYEELERCASEEDLKKLMQNENSVVAAYSWKAVLMRKPAQALDFLSTNLESLSQKEITIFLNGCQGTIKRDLRSYMIAEFYEKLLSREINLTASEIVDFLNFKEEVAREDVFKKK